jgi:hypothetical protein
MTLLPTTTPTPLLADALNQISGDLRLHARGIISGPQLHLHRTAVAAMDAAASELRRLATLEAALAASDPVFHVRMHQED